jgi:hypothetical protein
LAVTPRRSSAGTAAARSAILAGAVRPLNARTIAAGSAGTTLAGSLHPRATTGSIILAGSTTGPTGPLHSFTRNSAGTAGHSL